MLISLFNQFINKFFNKQGYYTYLILFLILLKISDALFKTNDLIMKLFPLNLLETIQQLLIISFYCLFTLFLVSSIILYIVFPLHLLFDFITDKSSDLHWYHESILKIDEALFKTIQSFMSHIQFNFKWLLATLLSLQIFNTPFADSLVQFTKQTVASPSILEAVVILLLCFPIAISFLLVLKSLYRNFFLRD